MTLDPVGAQQYEEWRVTGRPGHGYPPYDFTWSSARGDQDPERAARGFVAMVTGPDGPGWDEGPSLSRRTVTVTEWEQVGT